MMAVLTVAFSMANYVILLIASYYITVLSYRLLLHLLKSYPGPLLSNLTDFYGGIYSFQRTLHFKTWKDHKQYGPIVRQGPNKLIFNSVAAVHDIYMSESVSKAQCYQAGNVNPSMTNVFNTIDKHVHRIKRRHVGQLLTDRSVRTFEPKMGEQINVFLREIPLTYQNTPRTPINMSERCKYLGLDITGYLGFGWRLNMYMQFPALRRLRLEILFYALAIIQGKSFLQVLSKMIQSRLAKKTNAEHDLYAFMASAPETPEGDKINIKEIWNEGIFFLPAAGDTTSTALSALLFYLARNKQCRDRLAQEIRSKFSSSSEIKVSRLQGCQYLRACIYEALRMSPPVPGTLWREQMPSSTGKPFIVDGHTIPSGVQVGVNIYTLHRNPEYFPNPFQYDPDRWIPAKGDEIDIRPEDQHSGLKHNPAFMPFSLGGRGCAGKTMAYAEISLAMAKALCAEFKLLDIFTSSHDCPDLTFQPRGDHWKDLLTVHE
ncbi:benzoate 4-monooxygenase cytochrome P450 [Xylaria bambusicola]|uniref:benzoate 4-monooxygenase cytochrome P450 n=1 Tax=Xylaria bambusicola TaxID=326684 RepID=UPI0020085598|nr:benzoate 4-monooxygenase cytochrome P450 [Xylaria bambusicola]KAI0515079.1 benzoate 4-monooxygenase cytochrome P450 [Xylaria bambusicola]